MKMSQRRSLDPTEQALWNRVVQTVKPLQEKRHPPIKQALSGTAAGKNEEPKRPVETKQKGSTSAAAAKQSSKRPVTGNRLDSHWERRFKKAAVTPDVTVDLHGVALSGAYARLDAALEQAIHQNLRVMLLITGKMRRHDRISGEGRGAIASVVHDWLIASRHASHIIAVRGAHPRHGGNGALYIIFRK